MKTTHSIVWTLIVVISATGCSTALPETHNPEPSEIQVRRLAEFRERQLAVESERRMLEERAEAARRRKAIRLANAGRVAEEEQERLARENLARQERIIAAQRRELEQQERHRRSIAHTNATVSSMSIVTAAYDQAETANRLGEEVARIRTMESRENGVNIGGFRLGMDIQDAYLLARTLFKKVSLEPDSYRGSLRIRIGPSKEVDMSDSIEGAFVAGLFGKDDSFVFAEADPGSREVKAFRFTAEMVKNLIGIEGPISNNQLARTAFLKLELDWQFDYEYEVYIFSSSTERFIGYSKATKLANSLVVMNPGDFTLQRQ